MKKFLILSFALVSLAGCKKFLDRKNLDAPASDVFLSNATEMDLALTGVYSSSYWTEANLPIQSRFDTYTDLGLERTASFAGGTFDAGSGTIQNYYTYMYRTVSRANAMLSGMTKGKNEVAPALYNRYEAEAKVLRAWAYYHLVGLFGDVVFYTEPGEPSQYYTRLRSPKTRVIDSLILDLDDAAPKLNWAPAQRGRVSRGVALGLKAKLALLDNRWQVAADAAQAVITGGAYNLNPNFANLFTRAGQAANAGNEIMYEMIYPITDPNPVSYISLGQFSRTLQGQSGRFPIGNLVDRFETIDGKRIDESALYNPANPRANRDPRMKHTVVVNGDTIGQTLFGTYRRAIYSPYTTSVPYYQTAVANAGNTIAFGTTANADLTNPFGPVLNGVGYLWRKYSNDETDDMATAKTSWIYMRFAEILLIYAEAKIELNQIDQSVITAMNRVRNRAGMPSVDATIQANQAKLRQLVRRERAVEFANEGLRLFDIRRWNIGHLAMNGPAYGASRTLATPAAIPSFGAPGSPQDLNDIPNYSASDAQRFKRDMRTFQADKHILWPIPQRERDINPLISQNPNW